MSQDLKKLLRQGAHLIGEDKALSDALYGITINDTKVIPKLSQDSHVYVFFTRPQLNLSKSNIHRDRRFASLLTNSDDTIQAYVRGILDPRLHLSNYLYPDHSYDENTLKKNKLDKKEDLIRSSLYDNRMPFIPILSNALTSISGFSDVVLNTFTSSPGMRKEEYGWGDGETRIFNSIELDMTFKNYVEEPIMHLIPTWVNYISNVKKGVFSPYNDMKLRRETDYMSAIYVVVLGENKRTIKRIARTIGHPITDPQGKFFDWTRSESKRGENQDINVRFKCYGIEYNDPMLMLEFNKVMGIFDARFKELLYNNPKDGGAFYEVPNQLLETVSNEARPFIDLRYNTLEWLIDKEKINITEKAI